MVPSEEELSKIPRSFVMRSGVVGRSVSALVRDVRKIMEPHTASHLKVLEDCQFNFPVEEVRG